jgi:general secretion pathway protein G
MNQMRQRSRRQRKGFTLLEVMLVMAILVIIMGLASFSYFTFLRNAQADSVKTDCNTLARSCEAYLLDVGTLPTQLSDLIQPPQGSDLGAKWRGPYFRAGANGIKNDPWGQPFSYQAQIINNIPTAIVSSNGPDKTPGTADDISNISTQVQN